jgi:hypothetical protein
MRNFGVVIGCILLMSWFPVMADDMECGTTLISDDEESAYSMGEVQQHCGEPSEVVGDDWYYRKDDGSSYTLHFNDDGQLEELTAQ